MKKTDIKSLYLSELEQKLGDMGEKRFRAGQVYQWLHQKQVKDFGEMSNLSLSLREKLSDHFTLRWDAGWDVVFVHRRWMDWSEI